MSSAHPRDSTEQSEGNAEGQILVPSTDSPSPDDESLREENTLSACLLRILQSGKDCNNGDEQYPLDNSAHINGSCSSSQRNARLYDQVDCRRLYLPHCQRSQPINCKKKTDNIDSAYDKDEMDSKPEKSGDRMKSWRAAGEALRKVLVETGAVSLNSQGERKHVKKGCLKRGLRKKQEESASGEGSPASDDPMNMMLEEYQAQGEHETEPADPPVTKSLLAGVESVINNSEKAGVKSTPHSQKSSSQTVINVRERVQQITSRLGHMKSTPSGDIGGKKSHLHKYNRTTGPLQTRSSSIGHGSSSESEDEAEVKRHKVFVPRCRRVSSSSKSPKAAQESISTNVCPDCSCKTDTSAGEVCPKCNELLNSASQDRLSDLDNQEDMVTQKFKKLARNHENNGQVSDSDDTSFSYYKNYGKNCGTRLMSAETDSITNLADVESSLHSDENETLEESDINERRYGFPFGGDAPGGEKEKVQNGDDGSKYHGWGSDGEECWSEQGGTLKRNKEKKAEGLVEGDVVCEDLDDIPDLVFDDSSSGHENDGGHAGKGLPSLVTDSSGASASDGDAEADDEFECDCTVCQQHKTREASNSGNGWLTEEEEQILGALDSDRIEYLSSNSTNQPQVISPAELTPLDLLLMREGRRELLELMFQNVIMQMLTVYPDLLSDQAPPPAEPTTINDLPKIRVESAHISDDFVCPICLCRFELGEEVRELQCHHTFHGLCIQAWLCKSGTCPVCRCVVSSAS